MSSKIFKFGKIPSVLHIFYELCIVFTVCMYIKIYKFKGYTNITKSLIPIPASA